jgi:antitoxin (DNA-binding transcriptional repressor) of toxin-antitoxin stability system
MSVATLQQFGQSLPSWLALVQRGETVAIMDGGLEVARLVPPEEPHAKPVPTTAPVQWPDFAARRRAIFGDAVLPAGTAQSLVDEDRDA